jgi:hypothetical protein
MNKAALDPKESPMEQLLKADLEKLAMQNPESAESIRDGLALAAVIH